MHYVYILRSVLYPERVCVGQSGNLPRRLAAHNAGRVRYTSKYAPWSIAVAIAVPVKQRAIELEHYLKSGSGRAFARRHLL